MDNSLKDKILQSVDIVEVVGERVALARKGREYVGLCPFHPDHRPSLAVSPTKRIFKCWSCGAGGDVIRFVQLINRVEFREALVILAQRAGLDVRPTATDRRNSEPRDEILACLAWARGHFRRNLESSALGKRAIEYALARGLTAETMSRFGLGFAPDDWDDLIKAAARAGISAKSIQQAGLIATNENGRTYDRFRNRLMFPICDPLGRTIAFGGRTLGDDPAKYLNSPETAVFSKSRVLYGLDLARPSIQKLGAAVVVEGYMDAVMLSQHGIENVLATLGTALTDAHVKVLTTLARTLYLCFDGDDAGVRAADRGVEIALRSPLAVRVVMLPPGKDPADTVVQAGAAGFLEHLNGAVDALEFKWSQALRAFDASDQRGRREAIETFVRFVATSVATGGVDAFQQDMLVGRLSELLGIPPEQTFELIAREKRLRRARPAGEEATASACSDYEARVRGLPSGLVAAVESVLGLLLRDRACWEWVSDAVARSMVHSETWHQLYGKLLEVREDVGEYSLEDVLRRCDDAVLCELVHRAYERAGELSSVEEAFRAACARLDAEEVMLARAALRQQLHAGDAADARAYDQLRAAARGRDDLIPVERRWNLTTTCPPAT